jgi:hypothetical protein
MRDVTDKKISEAYKGILRITPISDISIAEDIPSNEGVYSQAESDTSANIINGILEPTEALIGKSKRYPNKKLPVTDSMGNYLNWNIGTDELTIGSDIFDSLEYTVLETSTIDVSGTSYIANAIMNDVKYTFNNANKDTIIDKSNEDDEDDLGEIIIGKSNENDFIVDIDSLEEYIKRKLKEYDE